MPSTPSFFLIILLMLFNFACQKQEEIKSLLPSRYPTSSINNPGDTTPISWNPNALVSTSLDVAVSSEFDGDIISGVHPVVSMMSNWNNAMSTSFFNLSPRFVANRDLNDLSDYLDDEMGVYKSHKWFSDVTANALAVTQYFAYRRNSPFGGTYYEMSHADIVLNYRDFSFGSPPLSRDQFDLRSVLVHEMGHFLGLQHNYTAPSSIMYPYLDDGEIRTTPSQEDKNKLSILYNGHSLALTGSSLGASFSGNESTSGPSSIRVVIEMDANHKCRHFINDKMTFEHSW